MNGVLLDIKEWMVALSLYMLNRQQVVIQVELIGIMKIQRRR